MFIPMMLLVPMALLAALAVAVIAIMIHVHMSDIGLCFLGKRELYLDKGVRRVRWCILYVPVYSYEGWHSTAML